MAASAKGQLRGNIITLDDPLPSLEGQRVRVVLEPAENDEQKLSSEEQARLWSEWATNGDQGPINDEAEPEFP
jgi:hypothetical protein